MEDGSALAMQGGCFPEFLCACTQRSERDVPPIYENAAPQHSTGLYDVLYGRELVRAVEISSEMQTEKRVFPDKITFSRVLNACVVLMDLSQGQKVHQCLGKLGMDMN
ncbi:hypothetical protein SELMODRAFT_418408 [Selaginella moellendorffii]|uniref:Uncharacterized protein n=1 Tax=Selaginella moellendorffii TaxID=88036 RepID=D8S5L6_SELML|nr:hypothetical protein SELMODRAFT_418408 [Selaginella moellendorffii]